MIEGEPGTLLEALAVLVPFHAGRAAPAQGDPTDGAVLTLAQPCDPPRAAPPRPAQRTARELPAPQTTRRGRPPANRRKSAPSGGPASAPRQVASATKDMREWLALRSRVKAEQLERRATAPV